MSYWNTLDAEGNRSTWTDNTHSTSVSYTYDSANRMTAAGSYTYGYDNDGNRTGSTIGGNTTVSTFDYEDRLTAIGSNASYAYIGASTDRYSKTVSGTTTQFLYDGLRISQEVQGSSYTATYSLGSEKLGSAVYWGLLDGQPSARQPLNSSQATVASYTTDAFGNSVASSGSAANPFQWNGGAAQYYTDTEGGLQKVGERYYEPSTGRWITQDSLLVAGSAYNTQSVNRYCYCVGDPVGLTDPLGSCFLLACAVAVIAIFVLTGCEPTYHKAEDEAKKADAQHRKNVAQTAATGNVGAGTTTAKSIGLQYRDLGADNAPPVTTVPPQFINVKNITEGVCHVSNSACRRFGLCARDHLVGAQSG